MDLRRGSLEHACARYGPVKRFDHEPGESVAIVTYSDIDDAIKARSKLNGAQQMFDGRLVQDESNSLSTRHGKSIDLNKKKQI